eukprot:CAMPEP_0182422342 /NCGR_PEP_ID=MMETSP1167-20130531/8001_1 /TAXON_ID=2988 /ORGANISM="Mallomonas Sp, Strain CCMP3275" /LENGTH=145 /DNA_ID=CAMNT_0024600321 /DNA_START=103 /DNA_END=537 /DNA_ORIENTATION=-
MKHQSAESSNSIEVGQRYMVSWRNGEKYAAEIIEHRPFKKVRDSKGPDDNQDSDPADFEYYVHYSGFDRRLDEWVSLDRIDHHVLPGTAPGRDGTRHKIRKSKRKFDELTDAVKDSQEVLATFEKEYEEITKVKNISTIELGRYE